MSAYILASSLGPTTVQATISNDAYMLSSTTADSTTGYDFCVDTGANRFVTNNLADFLPNSVRQVKTVVNVGGGSVTSPCTVSQ